MRNLAELHSRHLLLNVDDQLAWKFPLPGDEVNGYTLIEEIGRGAFSRVFLARDGHVGGRQVVVKTTYHACAEIELLGPMSHPHLPRIFYCQRDPETGVTTICMDWVGQRTLNDLIAELHLPEPGESQSASRTVSTAVRVIGQVADGLAYAQQHNVLHLDVKPSNILLRDDGTAVLIDFNLAVTASESEDIGFRGTLAYAAPEVIATAVQGIEAAESVSEAADVYSLGTVLYELLTGELPFSDIPSGPVEEAAVAVLKAKQQPVPRPSDLNPAVDRQLDQIVGRALAPSAKNRYSTADDFHKALRAYAAPRRERSPSRAVVLALSVCVILFTVFFSGSHGTISPEPQSNRLARKELSPSNPPTADAVVLTTDVERTLLAGWRHLLADDVESGLQAVEGEDRSSDDPQLAASAAYTLMLQEQFDAASTQFFKVHPHFRDDPGFVTSYAYSCLRARKRLSAARMALDILLKQHQDHETAMFLRTLIGIHLDEPPSARAELLNELQDLGTPSSARLVQAVGDYQASRDLGIIDSQLALLHQLNH